MKKLKILLMIIIGIVATSTIKVDAIENGSGQEPQSGIGYEIQNFSILVFNEEGVKKTQLDAGNSIKQFSLDADPTINMEPRIDRMKGDYKLVSVKLNFDGGLDSIRSQVEAKLKEKKSEIPESSSKKYLITFSVRYKLNIQSANGVNQIWDADYANVFSGDQQLIKNETETNKSVGISQMIFSGIMDNNSGDPTFNWENGAQYSYDGHVFTSRYNDMPLLDEYLLFGDGAVQIGLEKYRFMMHDIDNIESSGYWYPYEGENDDKDTPEKVETPTKNSQVVSVPNTDAKNTARLLFGSSILMIGSAIVLLQLSKKRTN